MVITTILEAWVIQINFTLYVYLLPSITFIAFFTFWLIYYRDYKFTFNVNIVDFYRLQLILISTTLISFIGLVIYTTNYESLINLAVNQYSKSLLLQVFQLLLFVAVGLYLSRITFKLKNRILLFLIFTVVASCIYQLLSIYLFFSNGLLLDEIVWPFLSYGVSEIDYSNRGNLLGRTGSVYLYRAGGFSINPNALAAQLVAVIPFLILYGLKKSKVYFFIALIVIFSLIATASRSGLLAFFVSMLALLAFRYKELFQRFKIQLFLLFLFIISMVLIFLEDILFLTSLRINLNNPLGSYIDSPRQLLTFISFDMLEKSPIFGIGNNISSVAFLNYPEVLELTGNNLHNFWVITLTERGLLGVVAFLVFYGYILYVCATKNNLYSVALFCSLLGLLFSSFFNSALMNFPLQLIVFLLFFLTCINQEDQVQESSYDEN